MTVPVVHKRTCLLYEDDDWCSSTINNYAASYGKLPPCTCNKPLPGSTSNRGSPRTERDEMIKIVANENIPPGGER